MKLLNTSLLLLAVTSAPALANDNDLYFGLEYLATEATSEGQGSTSTLDREGGFAISMGYMYGISDNFDLGFEATISDYGTSNFQTNGNVASNEYGVSSISVSLKPTYYIADSGFSVTGVLGYGSFSYDWEQTATGTSTTVTSTDSEFGYIYGVEANYDFNDNVAATIGYKLAEIDYGPTPLDYDLELETLNLGVKFRF
ncbi:OmpA-like transmembrane domain protein [Grimontia celer]|uniref:OmpA-like transmembrane domain protein n=1 Tax=Grimontia celer TaxID=1796497 RepID=A0A128EYF5_9GAMM|nr:outer membrane beta-barrel protein [Grimontia celer]CZF79527.1 OmpA-like transmembrane domain protein [Grimontia celer]